jgi:2-dehydro-3-deoxyphosphogluconate aldolase / (4S)-4-hydroxy-2-oxoglutarate aldolase
LGQGTAAAPVAERRAEPSPLLRESRIIAVLRADGVTEYGPVVSVLAENGVRSIEVTLTTPGALDALAELVETMGTDVEIGVGTVVEPAQAQAAIDAGARYLVTPVLHTEVIELAVHSNVPVYAGGLTPTELHAGWEAGATAVKIFPAETVGPRYGAHLRGPFPDLRFVPSGGIRLEDIPGWLEAGAVAVSLGSPLVGDVFVGGSLRALGERASRAAALARSVKENR